MIFRIYTETVWYPGRQLNYMNSLKKLNRGESMENIPMNNNSSSKGKSIMAAADDDKADVVEPPKFITVRNVASAFEKLGYDVANATKIFSILTERVAKAKKYQNPIHHTPNNSSNIGFFPPELLEETSEFRSNTQSSNSTGGNYCERDSFYDNSNSLPSQIEDENEKIKENNNNQDNKKRGVIEDLTGVISGEQQQDIPIEEQEELEQDEDTAAANFEAEQLNSPTQLKMDIDDFILACRMDDVLVQAIFRKPKQYISRVVRKATLKSKECNGLHPVSHFVEEDFMSTIIEAGSSNSNRKSIASAVGKNRFRSVILLKISPNLFSDRKYAICCIWVCQQSSTIV